MDRKRVERMRERERNAGLDAEDDAAKWLDDHDPPAPPKTPKSASKNKLLHRWKRQQSR